MTAGNSDDRISYAFQHVIHHSSKFQRWRCTCRGEQDRSSKKTMSRTTDLTDGNLTESVFFRNITRSFSTLNSFIDSEITVLLQSFEKVHSSSLRWRLEKRWTTATFVNSTSTTTETAMPQRWRSHYTIFDAGSRIIPLTLRTSASTKLQRSYSHSASRLFTLQT